MLTMDVTNRDREDPSMALTEAIRSAVPSIVSNYSTNTFHKQVLNQLITQVCSSKKWSVDKVYLMYYLMESLNGFAEVEVVKMFSTLLPIPLSKEAKEFMGDFVSLGVSLENRQILAAGSLYLDADQIPFPSDLESLPRDLVSRSPYFSVVCISKGFFNSNTKLFPQQLLLEWVKGLTKLPDSEAIPFDVKKLVEYSLLGPGKTHGNLHLAILEAMERRRVLSIPSQFMVSVAQSLASKPDPNCQDMLLDRFCQILLVSLESGVCTKFTTEIKQQTAELFPDNQFLLLILSAMN